MLEATGLSKTYKGRAVLEDVSFTLGEGEALGIAGHNGSGKSTLLSIVAQVQRPDTGDLLAQGKSILGDREFMRRQVGYVPQYSGLLGDLTVLETLRFWQQVYALPESDLFADSSVCSMLGLDSLQKKRVASLSGGMQKRLSIAIALLHSPTCLIFDESFSALDRKYRKGIREHLDAHKKRGGGILLCSHDSEDLHTICDRLLVLRGGRVAYLDSTAGLPTDDPALDALFNPA